MLESAVPMIDIAIFTIKHIKRLVITLVTNKVKADLFNIVAEYSKANGNLAAMFVEPIAACLLSLIDDDQISLWHYIAPCHVLSQPQQLPWLTLRKALH
jgi:hypothetical protein